jgi:hypothetical protein
MTERRRLPNRRLCESFTFELDGLRFTASVGRFPDGRVRDFLYWNGVRFGSSQKQNPVGEIPHTLWGKSPTPLWGKTPTPKGSTVGEIPHKGTGQTVGEIPHKSSLTTGYGSGGVLSERERARTLPLVTVIEGGKSPHCVHCGGSDEPLFRFRNGSRPVWLHRRCRRYWRQVREAAS